MFRRAIRMRIIALTPDNVFEPVGERAAEESPAFDAAAPHFLSNCPHAPSSSSVPVHDGPRHTDGHSFVGMSAIGSAGTERCNRFLMQLG